MNEEQGLVKKEKEEEKGIAKYVSVEHFIQTASGSSQFLSYIKVLQGMSEEVSERKGSPGDIFIQPDEINAKEKVAITIGPWRYKGMRINGKNVELIDYNLTEKSRYIPETNSWDMPDGITPIFRSLGTPENYSPDIVSSVGKEFLLYFPTYDLIATLWLRRTGLTMSKCAPQMLDNLGKTCFLCSMKVSSKTYSWFLPFLTFDETLDQVPIPKKFTQEVHDFLNPSVRSTIEEMNGRLPL